MAAQKGNVVMHIVKKGSDTFKGLSHTQALCDKM